MAQTPLSRILGRTFRAALAALLALLLALLVAVGISAVVCRVHITVTPYTAELEGLSDEVRLVLVSDLHSIEFGRDNSRLVALIDSQKPDAIMVLGDMVGRGANEEDVRSLIDLAKRLAEIAPVFYALGNHEKGYIDIYDLYSHDNHEDGSIDPCGVSLLDELSAAGITVLDDSFTDVTLGGAELRIGATLGHAFPFGRTWREFTSSDEYVFLRKLERTELPTIVMAHMPDTFIFNSAADYWYNVDLVLSGHTHGGLIRLPFVGGVYAPMQEFFPEYDKGHFYLDENMQMIITAGLAGYEWVPRLFNLPEICTLTLVPKHD